MNNCDEWAVTALRYLDDDLEEQELENFLSHLDSCASCREKLNAERDLSAILHRCRPLYTAPTTLHSRISAAVVQSPPQSIGARRYHWHLFQALAVFVRRHSGWRMLALAAIPVALCLAFVPSIVRNVRAANYVEAAVADHRRCLDGSVRLGVQSSSPEVVTAWFAHRVPFDFRLPAVESNPDAKPTYKLTGAAVVSYRGSPAALIAYETQNEKISLLEAANAFAVVAGGDIVRSGKLTFHYYNEAGFRVITWANHGLSYALVSSVSGPARASCLVCHQNMTDQSNFPTNQP
jgi:mycothiol system anti-sigma-R factor